MNRLTVLVNSLLGRSVTGTVNVMGAALTMDVNSLREWRRVNAIRKESDLVSRVREHCGPDAVVFDIGANIGLISLLLNASDAGQRPGCVHCFEPESRNFAKLQRNIALNGCEDILNPHRLALGDVTGDATLYTHGETGDGRHSISTDHKATGQETVPVMRASDFCEQHGVWPTLVKIDVEGAEGLVLSGMASLFESHPPAHVFVEVHTKGGADRMPDGELIETWFSRHGYSRCWTHTRKSDEHRHYARA